MTIEEAVRWCQENRLMIAFHQQGGRRQVYIRTSKPGYLAVAPDLISAVKLAQRRLTCPEDN